jgi:uncharacterized membrane protein YeaQ/YmgE (transglycosylase-associated protein family)
MGIITWLVLGLVAGVIAKWLAPGQAPGGIIVTIILGILGALLGGYIGSHLLGVGVTALFDWRSVALAVGGAVLVLFIYQTLRRAKILR